MTEDSIAKKESNQTAQSAGEDKGAVAKGQNTATDNEKKKTAAKPEFSEIKIEEQSGEAIDLDFLLGVPMEVTVELGRTRMAINDLLQLGQGSVLELPRLVGESLDILVNNKLVARGEPVVVNDKLGIRLTDIVSPLERIEKLK